MYIKTETRVGIFVLAALGVFAYMTLQIGVFRFDRAKYQPYTVTFKDASGISKKADVKIAGVKVGWVENIKLSQHGTHATIAIMVLHHYTLYKNAYALVRQDGLLGNKYLEVIPGDPLLPPLQPGQPLGQGPAPASIDEILRDVKSITENVVEVTSSFKDVIGGDQGAYQLQRSFENFNDATHRIAAVAQTIERLVLRNEENVNLIMNDIRQISGELRNKIPEVSNDIHRVAHSLEFDIFPSLDEAALQARDGFKHVNDVAQKLNEGRGLLGKLINEDDTYRDIKVAVTGLKNYFAKIESLGIVVDSHGESMQQPLAPFAFQNAKGYFNIRIHPNEDHFWLVGLVGSIMGYTTRKVYFREWANDGCPLIPADLELSDAARLFFANRVDVTKQRLDDYTYNLQFGKIFKDIAFRFGMFESTAGIGIDYDIPFNTDLFRWVMTFEAWDFRGRMRIADNRTHLKWLNSMFFLRNFYFNFGADDFISRRNKNAFFGVGLRFADDDIKYILSGLS